MDVQRRKSAVAWLSVVSNATLVLVKIVVGVLIGSVSVISEAIHSGVDLLAAVIALVAVHTAHKPADKEHPFGHGKVENISGTVEALLIFLAAGWIIFEAVKKLLHTEPVVAPGWGVLVMGLSAVVNFLVSHLLFKVGKETDSVALRADGWHLRTDVYTSLGVMLGLALLVLGGRVWPGTNLRWVDPVAAIGVALLIVRAAYQLTLEAARDLLDVSLPTEEEAWIRDYIGRVRPVVRGFHRLRTRKSGSMRFVDFHLLVDAAMTVEESHRIAESITSDIQAHFPGTSVHVHIEPCDKQCVPHCIRGCLLSAEDRETANPTS